MKKIFFLYASLLLIPSLTFSQEDIKLSYNSKEHRIEKPNKIIRKGIPYKIKIDGINTATMKFSVTAKDKELVSPIPEVLKPILLDVDAAMSLYKSTTGDVENTVYTDHEKLYNAATQILDDLKILEEKAKALNKAIRVKGVDVSQTKMLASTCLSDLEELILKPKTEKIKNSPKSKNAYKEVYNYLIQGIQNISSTRQFMESRMNFRFTATDAISEKFIQLHANLVALENQIKIKKYEDYLKFIKNAEDAKPNKIFEKVYYSRKDLLEAEVVMLDAFSKDTLLKETIDIYTEGGGIRLRFSTGFFYNDIVEKSYYLTERDETTKAVLPEKSPDFDIAVGALAHIGWKFSSHTDIALNMGLALSPLDGKTRYLLGGGILIGKKRELGLNIGAAISRIDKLSGSVTKSGNELFVPIAVEAVPTTKQNEWGLFFGVTYNFKNTKK
ncbi:hypothetical protein EJ994_04470 [Maribacter sp. MJ134]|uniref:hypothetical protein n=1 Tax=Maribacter sp. MJ134 TaxID=2496865 RepID=UPI000F8407DB|nr:hypothetical protein [Maribacter sp. MJ134]AZQ58097.1 hypothetical protein EJ994_04470 [Maribacter sp. MJ134]